MFSGIIIDLGKIAALEKSDNTLRMQIQTTKLNLDQLSLGDSIAVNGVCLTATELTSNSFWADVSNETLSCTTLGNLQLNNFVNLELALTPNTALGGHMVSGHVDGVGIVKKRETDGASEKFWIEAPAELAKYIATKGSICVDGVSLTVNAVEENQFELNIIPHTLQETTLSEYQTNTQVNLEVDIIARYLERLLTATKK